MKWRIDGADETTGAEQSVVLDARDQAEAERLARYQGILVASIRQDDAPSLEYATRTPADKLSVDPSAVKPIPALPDYGDILLARSLLRWLSWAIAAFGAICLCGVGLTLILPLLSRQYKFMTWLDWLEPIFAAIRLTAYALFLWIVAVLLRLVGALALVLRDIARNTFRP